MLAALAFALVPPLPAPVPPATDPVVEGSRALKQTIVDAIRNCPVSTDTAIAVCSRDRGFAEGERERLPKIVKPIGPPTTPAITVTVGDGTPGPDGCVDPRGCRRDDEDHIDAATRARLLRTPPR